MGDFFGPFHVTNKNWGVCAFFGFRQIAAQHRDFFRPLDVTLHVLILFWGAKIGARVVEKSVHPHFFDLLGYPTFWPFCDYILSFLAVLSNGSKLTTFRLLEITTRSRVMVHIIPRERGWKNAQICDLLFHAYRATFFAAQSHVSMVENKRRKRLLFLVG